MGGEFATPHISCRFRTDGLVSDWLAVYLSLSWGFSKREQRCVVSEGEDASVGETWGAGLADKMWVEPKAAARGKRVGITVGAEACLLDVQLAVLQGGTIRHLSSHTETIFIDIFQLQS